MKWTLVILILIIAFGSGSWLLFGQKPGTTPLPTDTESNAVHPKLAVDLYPLYAAAAWNETATGHIVIGTTTYSGASITSADIDANMDPAKVFMPFTQYYDNLLKSRGWHEANELAAGGHTGGMTGYQNGPGTILVAFHIEYKSTPKDAPSECPCTVSFSLFSSGATD